MLEMTLLPWDFGSFDLCLSNRWSQVAALFSLISCVVLGSLGILPSRPHSKFTYQSLEDPHSWIRLLTLSPSPNYSDPLVCRLRTFRLENAPPYEAISYHWGDSTCDQPIIPDSRQKLITKSLQLALRDLRHPFGTRVLWVDGLCINQDADAVEERNAQLLLMRPIFSQASRVLAWLSDADLAFWDLFGYSKL
jgi:hypothetical protein